MRIIDLSHPITPDMPLYPGTPAPTLEPAHTRAADGFLEHRLVITTHVGTHVDAPAHLLDDGATVDQLPCDRFMGRAGVLDAGRGDDGRVDVARLDAQRDRIQGVSFVLLRTGWSRHWGTPAYLEGFPCLTRAAARWLAEHGVRGFGVDTISVDPVGAPELTVHHTLLEAGLVLVENLTNLDQLPGQPFLFSALPLNLHGADGSPVRAVAVVDGLCL